MEEQLTGKILDYIDTHNEGNYHCYHTRKLSLDDDINDQFKQEGYDRENVSCDTTGEKYAETDNSNVQSIQIAERLIRNVHLDNLKYFLDGSRHTFKVDDIVIGKNIYPIIAGQIVIGCCYRKDRDSFEKYKLKSEIILSLPKNFYDNWAKREDYGRRYAEELTENLQKNNRYAKEHNLKISRIKFYEVDGKTIGDSQDKNRFINSGIAQIQNTMTDEEQVMVEQLCKEKRLSDSAFLVKDGSIQYNPTYSYLEKSAWNNMRSNYKNVVGISKSFDPTLLSSLRGNENIARIIADLRPYHRTKAFRYRSEQSNNQYFAVWYLRIRNSDFRQTQFSDVVKCELLMHDSSQPFETQTIDWLSANIIREAYPVCYGRDSRWANHLYPVFLTESFCKTQYIDKNIFLELF